jgi:hypothetical protein
MFSENADNFNENAAAAEGKTTRKPGPRAKRGAPDPTKTTTPPAPGEVLNPDSDVPPMNDAQLRSLLLSVDSDVPADAIAHFTASERQKSQDYGIKRQKFLAGTIAEIHVPAKPDCITKSETLPLQAVE